MSITYTISPLPLTGAAERPRRVLVTGAAGRIGSSFAASVRDHYRLRLLVHREEHLADVNLREKVTPHDARHRKGTTV